MYCEDGCVVCSKTVLDLESDVFVTLTQKGLNTLRQSSLERGDESLYEYLAAAPGCVKVMLLAGETTPIRNVYQQLMLIAQSVHMMFLLRN